MISTVSPSPNLGAPSSTASNKSTGTTTGAATTAPPPPQNNKSNNRGRKKLQPTQRNSPPSTGISELDRLHSLGSGGGGGSISGPVPLRRASYAFDHGQRHQKAVSLLYNNSQHHHSLNGTLTHNQHHHHQHSAPATTQHHQPDSSDCGSSSGLGGMGTPVKGFSGSCSASSNNSMAADGSSHDSRDSGGPISNPGAAASAVVIHEPVPGGGPETSGGHRSLVASATLTQSMICSQQPTTTISPVSSIPTLVQQQQQHQSQQAQQHQPQQQILLPPSTASLLGDGGFLLQHPQQSQQQQFGAFSTPSVPLPLHLPPNGPVLPLHLPLHPHQLPDHQQIPHHHQQQQQHNHHPPALIQNHHNPSSHNAAATTTTAAATTQLIAPAAAVAIQGGSASSSAAAACGQQIAPPPPLYCATTTTTPPIHQQQRRTPTTFAEHHQRQHNPPLQSMGHSFYTMTCETTALASVGVAAVSAGYHVTLEPCASAPPIIPPGGLVQQQLAGSPATKAAPGRAPSSAASLASSASLPSTAASDGGNQQIKEKQQQLCSPPPGFQIPKGEEKIVEENPKETAAPAVSTADSYNKGVAATEQNEPESGGNGAADTATEGAVQQNGGTNVSVESCQQQLNNGQLASQSSAAPNNNILLSGVPPEIAAAINGGHDLFVHIHPGDAIALAVGNEIQHIHGPATIRMVSQATPPTAIPMNVPQGHVVQQLLDSQGNLSHIIMSQEMPPTAPIGGGNAMPILGSQHPQQHHIQQSNQRQHHIQNSLQPHQHQIHQTQPHSSPSPQKSGTPMRYRPSSSSSASPPDIQQQPHHSQQQHHPHPPQQQQQQSHHRHNHHPQQHFVLPPSYDQHHHQQQHHQTSSQQHPPYHHQHRGNQQHQFLGAAASANSNIPENSGGGGGQVSQHAGASYGSGQHHPNTLNKWSPRGGHNAANYHSQQQQHYGRRSGSSAHIAGSGGSGANLNIPHGSYYIESMGAATTLQNPAQLVAGHSPSTVPLAITTGAPAFSPLNVINPPMLLEQQPPPSEFVGATLSAPQHLQAQQQKFIAPLGMPPPNGVQFVHSTIGRVSAETAAPVAAGAAGLSSAPFEEDEKERLRDSLSSLQPPVVTRVGERDADVVWQELDTSEAAASLPGFPEINQSEFSYQLILHEQNTSSSVCYKTDANSGNVLHLQRLRPATDYMICIRADLPGHSIIGHPSAYTAFHTNFARPDAPTSPRLVGRQQAAVSLCWRPPNCNGAPIIAYCLQMAKGKSAPFDSVYDGPHDQTHIGGLEPGCVYRFRVCCRNEIGQSDWSPPLNVYPERDRCGSGGAGFHHHSHQQQQPHHLFGSKGSLASSPCSSIQQQHQLPKLPAPTILSVSAKSVKLSWNDLHSSLDCLNITLEMSDFSMRGPHHFVAIPVEFYANSGTFANVTGLQSNREYRFRLSANTAHDEHFYSEMVAVRTRLQHYDQQQQQQLKEQQQHHHHRYEQQQPHHERHQEKPPMQQQQKASRNIIEDQQQQQQKVPQPSEHQHQQRGSLSVQQQQQQQHKVSLQQPQKRQGGGPQSKKQQQPQQKPTLPQQKEQQQQKEESESGPVTTQKQAAATPIVLVKQPPPPPTYPKPPVCSAPKFSGITSESAKITWALSSHDGSKKNGSGGTAAAAASSSPKKVPLKMPMFELQRVDRQQPQICYSGSDMEFELKGLRPVEHLQVRVRAVLLDTEGRRFEGEWSPVGSACTLCASPSAPRSLRFDLATTPSSAAATTLLDEEQQSAQSSKKLSTYSQQSVRNPWTIVICWDPPAHLNGAPVVEYSVHSRRFISNTTSEERRQLSGEEKPEESTEEVEEEEESLLGSTSETKFQTPKLQPAQRYVFTVCAHNEAGISPKSEQLEYNSPPGAPEAPRNCQAEALSTSELQISWMEPLRNNGSTITSYHINCYKLLPKQESSSGRQRQLVNQQIVPGSQRTASIQSLETESDYEIALHAENSIGKSHREVIRCSTMAEPPAPPELMLAQATANTLKLRWNIAGDAHTSANNNNYYYLEKENENGTYSSVYEGDLKAAKVKGLREHASHNFRIRAGLAKGLMLGTWSRRYSFQTTRQPPPALKHAPTVTEHPNDLFQFEWNSFRSKEPSGDQRTDCSDFHHQQVTYRLQIAPKISSSAKEKSVVEVWKTVYEGASTSFTLHVPNTSQQSRQARLFIVQKFFDADCQLLEECVSPPSPSIIFSSQKSPNESPKKRAMQGGKNAPGPSNSGGGRSRQQQAAVHYPNPKEAKITMYKRLKRFGSWIRKTVSEKDCALIVLAIFVVLAFGIAILLNNYYLN